MTAPGAKDEGSGFPAIGLGCMRMAALSRQDAARLIRSALDRGINFFDHADIYGDGGSEEVFRDAVREASIPRNELILQSKCGIRDGYWDFSAEHIIASAEGSLARLGTDRLDLFLLHRPDALMEPEEVAAAFSALLDAGKVRRFGVSNFGPSRLELLQAALPMKLEVNQLQFSAASPGLVRAGMNVNMENDAGIDRDGGILDYCRLRGIAVQAWSPLQYGFFGGTFIGSPRYPELNAVLDRIASERRASPAAVAVAWILRHPANIMPIVGTTNPGRLSDLCEAARIELSRKEWYEIYAGAGNRLP